MKAAKTQSVSMVCEETVGQKNQVGLDERRAKQGNVRIRKIDVRESEVIWAFLQISLI